MLKISTNLLKEVLRNWARILEQNAAKPNLSWIICLRKM
jgi:hypothetical protein